MSEMFVESLRRRVRAMNTLWQRAVSDMTLEHVNHHERAGVLPIAFSLSHYIRSQDEAISRPFLGETPLWVRDGWATRVGVTVDQLGREQTVEEMEHLRFADFDAWRAYQGEVIARTDAVLDAMTEESLAVALLPKLPPNMQNIFCAMVTGPDGPLRRLEVMECFVYQHGLRHMGEIEHGRALVGLGGMTS
ncbi:MAG: hypothetical protein EPO22_04550 [Dehalococcoidia bacterium]|nr:MAG: hypothetical protein EPO22_04550 [Dehalococcoidia bacterium]